MISSSLVKHLLFEKTKANTVALEGRGPLTSPASASHSHRHPSSVGLWRREGNECTTQRANKEFARRRGVEQAGSGGQGGVAETLERESNGMS